MQSTLYVVVSFNELSFKISPFLKVEEFAVFEVEDIFAFQIFLFC